ncbi:hypothetical protein Aduo_019186 [Ancylostoma duodenale]
MRRLAAAGRHRRIRFTDEKMFTLNSPHNHHNDRVLLSEESRRIENVHTLAHRHLTTSVLVWAGSCASGKTPFVFIEKGTKITAEFYQNETLKKIVVPWISRHFDEEAWTF